MPDLPHALELLAIARSTLMDAVLPAVPEAARYEVRMIANAMAIAERELRLGAPEDLVGSDATALDVRIRAGEFDAPGAKRDALERELGEWVRRRLAISNPKILGKSE